MKENTKKKKRIILFVVIATVLVVAGIVSYAVLAPKTIEGDWELIVNPEVTRATPDEAEDSERVYYSFSKPGEYGDGTYKTFFEGGVEEGTYKLSEKDGKKFINMGTEDLEYTIGGSKLFGTAKLTITYPERTDEETGQSAPAQDYFFAQAKAPDYEKESYSSFKTDDALIGEWVTNERTLSYYLYDLTYTETVRFDDNGIMTIHYESADLMLDRILYYAYTAENGTLTFSLVTDKETQYSVGYGFEDDNLRFKDDTTSDSIFADAFFSDVTYLPKTANEKVTEAE